MSRRIIAGLAAAGVAILAAACQDRSPNAFLPTEASLAKAPPPAPVCSFTAANTYAKNYFVRVTGNTKDPVFAALDAMQKVATPGGNALETSAGFTVLTRVAAAAGTADVKVGAEAQGSAFVNEVALCQNLNGFVYLSSQFTNSLSYGGLFAVRANGNTNFILARTGRYGAQPTTSAGWPISSGQALFYGVPLADQSTLNSEALIGGTAFDLKTLPTPLSFVPNIRVGICDMDLLSSDNPRILHVHAGSPAAVLAQSAPTFCPSTFGSIETSRSIFTVAAHEVASWLSPKPAYAANMMFLLKIGGGTVGGLSEIGSIAPQNTIIFDTVLGANVSDSTAGKDSLLVGTLPDTMTIADTTTTQFQPAVRVRVLTKASKTPIGGVTVNLTVIGNKGSYVANGGKAVTDADGYARFPNFYINKAGGYTISAQAAESEFGPGSFTAISNLFNISGQ